MNLRIFWLIPALLMMLASANGQHNAIFNGGSEDGNSSIRTSTASNNGIFNGSIEDGFANSRSATSTNNGVFSGGLQDGYTTERAGTALNNGIYSGGINDGYDKAESETPSNNGIYPGGIQDGYVSAKAGTQSNNGIYPGGIQDGYASLRSDVVLPDPPLPIELLYFSAKAEGSIVITQWETASEWENDYFTVEKSRNTTDIIELGRIASQGNTTDIQFYEMPDPSPYSGTSYYRLRQTDLDGTESWSDWVAVSFEDPEIREFVSVRVIPNPVTGDKFDIELTGFEDAGKVDIILADMKGVILHKESALIPEVNIYRYEIVPSKDLATGTYAIVVSSEDKKAHAMVFIAR